MNSKPTNKQTGMRKREQIDAANKTVFLWAMAAAAALALCAVLGYFLTKEIIFNGKILAEKQATLNILHGNIENAVELEKNVKALIANNDLARVKANPSDSNYKVVLDALPVSSDPTVLGSSLLQEVLSKSGITVESLNTMSADGGVSAAVAEDGTSAAGGVVAGVTPIPFNFTVTGNYERINEMLHDMELSIRPLSVKRLTIQGSDNSLQALVEGESYYSSQRSVELGTKQVKP